MNALREPWLARAMLEPVSWLQGGAGAGTEGDGRPWRPPSPAAQIVWVECTEGVSGSRRVTLSDGFHFVEGVLAVEALKRCASRYPSLGTARLRGALVVVERYAIDLVARCERPTNLDDLAFIMRVTAFRYLGCEGASPFGDPSDVKDELQGYRDALRLLIERARARALVGPSVDPKIHTNGLARAATPGSVLPSVASAASEISAEASADNSAGGVTAEWPSDPGHPLHGLLSQVTALASAVDMNEPDLPPSSGYLGGPRATIRPRSTRAGGAEVVGSVERADVEGADQTPPRVRARRVTVRDPLREMESVPRRAKRARKALASERRGAIVQAQIRIVENWQPSPSVKPSSRAAHHRFEWVVSQEIPSKSGRPVPLLSRRKRLQQAIRAREAARREGGAKSRS